LPKVIRRRESPGKAAEDRHNLGANVALALGIRREEF
jgi:hypothetical protein